MQVSFFVVVFVLIGGLLGRWIWRIMQQIREFRSVGVPAPPPGHFLFGHMLLLRGEGFKTLIQWSRTLGKVYAWEWGLFGPAVIGIPGFYMVSDVDAIHKILALTDIGNSRSYLQFMGEKPTLFGQRGPEWKKLRMAMNPSFNGLSVREYHSSMVEVMTRLLDKLQCNQAVEYELDTLTNSFALDILGSTAFGANFHALEDDDCAIVSAIRKEFDLLGQMRNPIKKHFLKSKLKEAREPIKKLAETHFKLRKQNPSNRRDLLNALISAQKDNPLLTDEDIVREIRGFIPVGHETTGHALCWILWYLAKYPAALRKVREEVDSVFQGVAPNPDQIPQLQYTTAVIKETLRLRSPANLGVARYLSDDMDVAGYHFPKGSYLFANFLAVNYDPEIWGEDVEEWKPERFQSETRKEFSPFSLGQRSCIGQHFSMHEMHICVSSLVKHFDWVLRDPQDPGYILSFVARPERPIPVTFTQRKD